MSNVRPQKSAACSSTTMVKQSLSSSELPSDPHIALRSLVLGNALVLLCGLFVLLGAIYFCLASCGGYVWHKQVFYFSGIGFGFLALITSSSLLPSVRSKLVFALAVPLLFVVTESAVAPFYPGPPNTFHEFAIAFLQALEYGPCG